jgi:hypothetical protein
LISKLRGKLPLVGVIVAVCALAGVLGVSSLASATSAPKAAKKVTVKRVFIRGQSRKNPPHFVAPRSIHAHDKLKIINQTDPSKIGPHTFAMVKARVIPRTNKQQKACFKKGHICRKIFHWHKNGKVNPVEVGRHGWDVQGDLRHKGDSWLTGTQPNSLTFRQRVAGDAPAVIHFMCAIHPFMHGKIIVKP